MEIETEDVNYVNPLYGADRFKFMREDVAIGFFTITTTRRGAYKYILEIGRGVSDLPLAFYDMQNRFIGKSNPWHTAVMRNWVEERIFPEERQNADELLRHLGLSVYDQAEVAKATRLGNMYDHFWIKVKPEDTYKTAVLSRWEE